MVKEKTIQICAYQALFNQVPRKSLRLQEASRRAVICSQRDCGTRPCRA